MYLIEIFDRIKKYLIFSQYQAGYIDRIFEYNERAGKNIDGTTVKIIKLDPEEKNKRKSIN
tara:strand:+ start:556 stop:738 length:183 start_codon:yes stop_codon:yes gene_type:complete